MGIQLQLDPCPNVFVWTANYLDGTDGTKWQFLPIESRVERDFINVVTAPSATIHQAMPCCDNMLSLNANDGTTALRNTAARPARQGLGFPGNVGTSESCIPCNAFAI